MLFFILFILGVTAFITGGMALYYALLAPRTILLSSFNPVASLQDDCDSIRLTAMQPSAAGPGSVEIFLHTLPRIDWKAIELFISGSRVAILEAQNGSHAPGSIVVAPHQLDDAQLVFLKAKTFGVHTKMYQINGLASLANHRATFIWERDRC